MKFHIFGTCAGTEPIPGRKHVSLALEHEGRLYWFDAGEGCSRSAHLMGLDLLAVRAIFITHPHMDHVGGLGNLLWNIRKMVWVKKADPYDGAVDLITPSLRSWEGLRILLGETEGNFRCSFQLNVTRTETGTVWDKYGVKVEAIPNTHLPPDADGHPISYSYRVKCGGKTAVLSGDVGSYDDLAPFLEEGCDALFAETGHHDSSTVAEFLKERGWNIGTLCYIHNGRDILRGRDAAMEKLLAIRDRVIICEDDTTIEI